jgi:hypothetical protein
LLRFLLLAPRLPKDDLGSLGNLLTCNTGERQEADMPSGACVYLCDVDCPLLGFLLQTSVIHQFHGDIECRESLTFLLMLTLPSTVFAQSPGMFWLHKSFLFIGCDVNFTFRFFPGTQKMPILQRKYPPELAAAIANARRFHEFAWKAGPEKGAPNAVRMQTFGGFLTTLFEHHDSTVLLLETGSNNGSGFALIRVLVETFHRGLWLYCCASDAQVNEIRAGGKPYPKFIDMTQQVDRALGSTGTLELGGPAWGSLCGFTHTGIEQLSRRFNTEGDLFPNYPLEEILQVISSATKLVSTMSQFLCVVARRSDDAELIAEFWEELYAGKT